MSPRLRHLMIASAPAPILLILAAAGTSPAAVMLLGVALFLLSFSAAHLDSIPAGEYDATRFRRTLTLRLAWLAASLIVALLFVWAIGTPPETTP